mgnify:CR=1 FL=1
MKLNYISKRQKKAFTLIELLIVIAIIGILFVVLVSRVDFATDKAKATGVQTDFRSFQVAFDTVAKEHAGFNTFGWDTGDDNGDRIRNSYDEGDIGTGVGTPGYHNGKVDSGEIWTGHKVYGETWSDVYTLVNPADNTDTSAFVMLENCINANLDPKLHITITPELNGTALTGNAVVSMANGAQDPWKNEYHGVFITNAERDNGTDRGAVIIYSDGANGKWGSDHDITNGVVTVTVPNNNIAGKDDYSITSCYTYTNGFGEVQNLTTGFSTNQTFLSGGLVNSDVVVNDNIIHIEGSNITVILPEGVNKDDVVQTDDNIAFPDVNKDDEPIMVQVNSLNVSAFKTSVNVSLGEPTEVSYEKTVVTPKEPKEPVFEHNWGWACVIPNHFEKLTLDDIFRQYEEMHGKLNPANMTLVYGWCQINYGIEILADSTTQGTHGGMVVINQFDETATVDDIAYKVAWWLNVCKPTYSCPHHPDNKFYCLLEWDGTQYIEVDIRSLVEGFTDDDFYNVETIVETQTVYSQPTYDVKYVTVPYGTIQYEEGMTWAQWLSSPYNTANIQSNMIKTKDYADVSLTEVINPNKEYCFVLATVQGKWRLKDNIELTLGTETENFYEEVSYKSMDNRNFTAIIMNPTNLGWMAGFLPVTVYSSTEGLKDNGGQDIDFGSTPQNVSQELYEWLFNNAFYVGP